MPPRTPKNQIWTPGAEDMKGVETVRYIPKPDPWLMRLKHYNAAKAGELPFTECNHPVSAIRQFVDVETERDREGRPTNLFECLNCHYVLWLVDATGKAAFDG